MLSILMPAFPRSSICIYSRSFVKNRSAGERQNFAKHIRRLLLKHMLRMMTAWQKGVAVCWRNTDGSELGLGGKNAQDLVTNVKSQRWYPHFWLAMRRITWQSLKQEQRVRAESNERVFILLNLYGLRDIQMEMSTELLNTQIWKSRKDISWRCRWTHTWFWRSWQEMK